MTAADLTVVELITRLRDWAEGHLPTMAAVELLIAHVHWLSSPGFLDRVALNASCLSGTPMAIIDWESIPNCDDGRPSIVGSSGELAVLAVACSLGGGVNINLRDVIGRLDPRNLAHVADALRMANGRDQ